jgi:hypothetical protein
MGRLMTGIATVIVAPAITTATASASDVPCSKLSAGKYQCSFYPAGNGISAGAPVQDSTGKRVGYLNHGANWIVCQASGATVHNGADYNRWWGYTEANDQHFGWVNAVWASGGSYNGPFGAAPNCGSDQPRLRRGAAGVLPPRRGRLERGCAADREPALAHRLVAAAHRRAHTAAAPSDGTAGYVARLCPDFSSGG